MMNNETKYKWAYHHVTRMRDYDFGIGKCSTHVITADKLSQQPCVYKEMSACFKYNLQIKAM